MLWHTPIRCSGPLSLGSRNELVSGNENCLRTGIMSDVLRTRKSLTHIDWDRCERKLKLLLLL